MMQCGTPPAVSALPRLNLPPMTVCLFLLFCSVFSGAIQAGAASLSPYRRPLGGVVSDAEARLRLARLLSEDDATLQEAETQYRRLIHLAPGNAEAVVELADVLMRLGKYGDAAAVLHGLRTDRSALSLKAAERLSAAYLLNGDYQKAADVVQERLAASSASAEMLLTLARSYAWRGDPEAAVPYYEEVLGGQGFSDAVLLIEAADACLYSRRWKTAAELYRRALAHDPDDRKARRGLALALARGGRDQTALPILEALLAEDPGDKDAGRELLQLYIRMEKYQKALLLGEDLSARFPEDPQVLVAAAELAAARGLARPSRQYFEAALTVAADPAAVRLAYAAGLNRWGDFYRVENIYRGHLQQHPDDARVRRKLAEVLVSSQRYDEAESIYRGLLLEGEDPTLLMDLARLYSEARDDRAVLRTADRILDSVRRDARTPLDRPADGLHSEILRLRAVSLARLGRSEAAAVLYRQLAAAGSQPAASLVALGRLYLRTGKPRQARAAFAEALAADSEDLAAQFYAAGLNTGDQDPHPEVFLGRFAEAPMKLVAWGRLYSENRRYDSAVRCYRRALEIEPDCFPARLALAETLAYDRRYALSDAAFRELNARYPANRKIRIGWARMLSWDRRYKAAEALYRSVIALNPEDPVPRIELARITAWAKDMERAEAHYRALWQEPVDEKLRKALEQAADAPDDLDSLKRVLQRSLNRKDRPYSGYERFTEAIEEMAGSISSELERNLCRIRAELGDDYRIQKKAWLENRAKVQARERRWPGAYKTYKDLIEMQPGNQEAMFDFAQVQCVLGLCGEEGETYEKLLRIEPDHTLAEHASARRKIRSRPAGEGRYHYWREEGRDRLSRIERTGYDLSADVPIRCRYRLRLEGHRFVEDPLTGAGVYKARGHTVALDGPINEHISGAAGWTRKDYDDSNLSDTDTGFARLWFMTDCGVRIGGGWDKANEIYNEFGILQSIQSSTGWLGAEARPGWKWNLQARFRQREYSDDNAGQHHSLSIGYRVTEHPRLFKATFSADYRDTENASIYRFQNGTLSDIVHPYWTPRNHLGGAVVFEWLHDLSAFFFCGAPAHFYNVLLTLGTESDANESISLEGQWRFDFMKRWSLNVKGFVHRSRLWDADGLWAAIKYHF